MKLHFFTINDIEDYRNKYNNFSFSRKLVEELKDHAKEEIDQKFFYNLLKDFFQASEEHFESEIYGETGYPGLRLDFNFGLRLDVPEGNFRIKISDFDTEEVYFDKYISGGRLLSVENYFINWHVEVFLDEEKIFSHTFNPEGHTVAIMFRDSASFGDTLAFLPYLREFKKVHKCNLSICPPNYLRDVVAAFYPDFTIIDKTDFKTYATYYPLMITTQLPVVPVEVRRASICRMGGLLFGIDYLPPKVAFKPIAPPVTNEPYVCIAVQSTLNRKCWLYPGGWDVVVNYLKSLGYRVFCIDKDTKKENDGFTICKPEGAEDFTGNISLLERANMLYHAEFFIGLSSGLAWLADAVNCTVVMICGFSQDWSEFYTPYRVANRKVCNGCLNNIRAIFLEEVCPYNKKTPRELECQKMISPRMVIDTIERLIVDKNLTPPVLR